MVCNLWFLSSLSTAVYCEKLFALCFAGKFVSAEALCSHWTNVYISFLLWHPRELKPHIRVNTRLGFWYLLEVGKPPSHLPQVSGWSFSRVSVVAETSSLNSQDSGSPLGALYTGPVDTGSPRTL